MTHYLINFSVYTTAMIGLIFFALYIFKICSAGSLNKKSSILDIIDTLKLSPRKTLYVIKAENEKFLIAADLDKTTMIAKLSDNESSEILNISPRKDKSAQLDSFDGIKSLNEFSSIIDFKPQTNKKPVMKELARKIQK